MKTASAGGARSVYGEASACGPTLRLTSISCRPLHHSSCTPKCEPRRISCQMPRSLARSEKRRAGGDGARGACEYQSARGEGAPAVPADAAGWSWARLRSGAARRSLSRSSASYPALLRLRRSPRSSAAGQPTSGSMLWAMRSTSRASVRCEGARVAVVVGARHLRDQALAAARRLELGLRSHPMVPVLARPVWLELVLP